MTTDTLRLDVPTGKQELALLKTLKVGDVRKGSLFPALPLDVEWTCLQSGPVVWVFDGMFCGIPVAVVEITQVLQSLVLTVREVM